MTFYEGEITYSATVWFFVLQQGLELHKGVLSPEEQDNLIEHIRSWVAAVRRPWACSLFPRTFLSSCWGRC